MNTSTKKSTSKAKRFTVLAHGEAPFQSSKHTEATAQVTKLQHESNSKIILVDTHLKQSTHFIKLVNQQNYRIKGGDYAADLKTATAIALSEHVKGAVFTADLKTATTIEAPKSEAINSVENI